MNGGIDDFEKIRAELTRWERKRFAYAVIGFWILNKIGMRFGNRVIHWGIIAADRVNARRANEPAPFPSENKRIRTLH